MAGSKRPVRDEVTSEIEFHLEMRTREFIAAGLPPAEARDAARRAFGNLESIADSYTRSERRLRRRQKGRRVAMRVVGDVKDAFKVIRRGRAVTVLAILAFALGIGITTAVFSLFYGVLLKPLPYPNPEALTLVYNTFPACQTCPASFPKYIDWKTRNTSFVALGASTPSVHVITGLGDPERVSSARATASLVNDVFEVRPLIGRWFTEDEDTPGGPKVVVLDYTYWQRRFPDDRTVIGRTLTIDGEPHQIVGVMPSAFAHRRAEIFVPVQLAYDGRQRFNHFLQAYGRLEPGTSIEQARTEMQALGETLGREHGYTDGIEVQSLYRAVVGAVERPLQMLMGAVILVLLIAVANVANLLLASGLSRRRELAVRTALGATRWDLARQITIESVLLAGVGGVLGVLLAYWATTTFVTMAGTILPRAQSIAIDRWVLAFAAGLSLATGVFCGLWPVIRLQSRALAAAVRENDLRSGASGAGRRFGNGLVVVEIAMACALLIGAGLFMKSLLRLESRDVGFSADRIVAFDLSPTGARYQDSSSIDALYRDLLTQLRNVSAIESAGLVSHLPMYRFGFNGPVALEGGSPWPATAAPPVEYRWVGGDYFETMGIDLVRGRLFDDSDRRGAPTSAIVSARTAEKFWPGQDPIGRRFVRGNNPGPNATWYHVVGVVRDVRSYGLQANSPYELYVPIEQETFGAMTVVLRTSAADPTVVIEPARQIVRSLDARLPLARVQTMRTVVADSVNQPRLISALTSLFGALAGVLAAVGVYGVMAYNVRRERREYGIRLALGAQPATVCRLILQRGLMLGLAGIALGLLLAVGLAQMLQSMLADVQPTDPFVFSVAASALLGVAIAAVIVPATQAARTDPMIVLRSE
ncbi:MAG TPA: ABC transporter permease [Vicinamibacterales bacterium]|nr:ABC transporter permease [Vicinamibacterales bacterium]